MKSKTAFLLAAMLASRAFAQSVAFSPPDSSNASDAHHGVEINAALNQSGTAGFTDFFINRTETSLGSGNQYFENFRIGGVDKWIVDRTGTLTLGTWNGAPIGVAFGGTGQTTAAGSFNALSPMTTLGDLIYGDTSGAGTRLAGSTSTAKLFLSQTGTGSASAAPAWSALSGSDIPSINLAASGNGGVTGNLPVANLNGGTSASSGTFWRGDGTWSGLSSGNIPAINLASSGSGGVTGNLPVANLNGGSSASSTTYWRGDGTWATPPSAGVSITSGKTLTVTNTLTLTGTDGSTLDIGGGGSLGENAFTTDTDGWMVDANSWTYTSATSFTTSGDRTGTYVKGVKLKYTQSSTTKYAYVIDSSYSSGTTTVTITGGSDYLFANAVVTATYYSRTRPQGFPNWFNYTPTITGFSTIPPSGVYRFNVEGSTVNVMIRQLNTGTSNATTFTISAPVTAANITDGLWVGVSTVTDSGTTQAAFGLVDIIANTAVINVLKSAGSGSSFSGSGAKRAGVANLSYEF